MISEEEVMKIARLAHLYVSKEELPEYAEKLGKILDYIKQLQSVDVSGITPMSHVHGSTNVFVDDQIGQHLGIESLAQNAPAMNGRFIKVPIIIE